MGKPILVVYYSMSGTTRRLAEALAKSLDADLDEIREPRARRGLIGVMRAMVDALLRREPGILLPTLDPLRYRMLVLGGPVWAGRLAAPVRSYARQHAARARNVALFCTEGGRGGEAAIAELRRLVGWGDGAQLVVKAEALSTNAHAQALQAFVAALHPAPAAVPAVRHAVG